MRNPSGLLLGALAALLLLVAARAADRETLNVLSSLRESLALHASDGLQSAAVQAMQAPAGAPPGRPAAPPPAPVLAYITPWNGAGYDLAKRHRCRLHYMSPVWFQLQAVHGELELTGGHDVDVAWMAAVRAPCPGGSGGSGTESGDDAHAARVLPRVIFEVGGADLGAVLSRPEVVASLLASAAQEHGFDGWVVEVWSGWASMGVSQHPQAREAALQLLRQLAAELQGAGRALVLAVSPLLPAPGRPVQLTAGDAADLLGFADALSVMTYAHATQQAGPNAPLPWVAQNADAFAAVADRLSGGSARAKVLLGIPFYGYEYRFQGRQLVGAEAATSRRLLEVLSQRAEPAPAAAAAAQADGAPAAAEQQQQQQGSCSAEEVERDTAAGGGACAAGGSSSGSSRQQRKRDSKGGLSTSWLGEAAEHLLQWKEPAAAADSGGVGSGSSGSGSESGSSKKKRVTHRLYFPTPRAVAERLAVAAQRGMGVSVWELGQGLEEMAALL